MEPNVEEALDESFSDIVRLSGVARDALVVAHGTGIGAETGHSVQWWIIRKTKNDAPYGKPKRVSHTWWGVSHCLVTDAFECVVAADWDQARWKINDLVRWPVARTDSPATS